MISVCLCVYSPADSCQYRRPLYGKVQSHTDRRTTQFVLDWVTKNLFHLFVSAVLSWDFSTRTQPNRLIFKTFINLLSQRWVNIKTHIISRHSNCCMTQECYSRRPCFLIKVDLKSLRWKVFRYSWSKQHHITTLHCFVKLQVRTLCVPSVNKSWFHFSVFCLQLLECVRRGVSLLVRNSGGCSALHIAAQNGHTELVSYILQQGESVHDVHVGVCVCDYLKGALCVIGQQTALTASWVYFYDVFQKWHNVCSTKQQKCVTLTGLKL